jgi:CDP-diacylglycerol--glycerol-3-phosphate 3-phosphatidyltransferase
MKHVPNVITVVRILFAPAFFVLLILAGTDLESPLRWWAAGLFIFGMATDGIDGWLARRFDAVSDFGKLMDPIADKVLTGGAIIAISVLGELPWWVTALILIREIGITVWRMVELGDNVVVAASWAGKVKTVLQFFAISAALLPLAPVLGDGYNILNVVLMTVATVATLASGLDYLVAATRARRASRG